MSVKNNRIIRIMLLIVAAAALAIGAFRTFLLVNYIEPETGFYIAGTNVDVTFNIMLSALLLVVLACGYFARKINAPEFLDSRSTVMVFSSALCAFMYISVFFYGIYTLVMSDALNIALVLQVALCIPCCLNHISICSKEIREKNTPQSLLAMSEAVFFALRIVESFMDVKSQINVSQRSIEIVLLCAMMMFFLFEAKFQIKPSGDTGVKEEESIAKYVMSALATVAFSVIAVLPYLAVSLFWCFDSSFVVMDILECCIMLFAASRLLTLHETN